ncbi:MAG: glycoside hydrolase family 19 protein [Pseudomonadota bacterium]
MKTHIEMMMEMGVSQTDVAQYIDDFEDLLPRYGIARSKVRLSHFFAQILHESGSLRFDSENLNYSAKALRLVFGKYFKTEAEAAEYARQPERIANRVYARRMGNGVEASGDGWRYRGRGFIQLTGKKNYQAFAKWMKDPAIVDSPQLVASDYPVHSAVFFWDTNQLNKLADKDDVRKVTRRVNGGYNGLAHRQELHHKANGLLSMLALSA